MTDREIALDIGKRWLESEAQITALEAFLEESLPDWKKRLSPIHERIARAAHQQRLAEFQHAIDEDTGGDSHLRILHRMLFER